MNPLLAKSHSYAQLMRWHRPVGSLLLLWPTLWALWIAAHGAPPIGILSIFICGVFLMRSAGCVINDLTDQRYDGFVARTKTRPLVTGQVSRKEAAALFALLCLLAASLLIFLNPLTRWLAVPALLLASSYPLMKRYTHLPQFILGLAFSWGIPMAFAAQMGQVPLIAWFLLSINVVWTVAYDTIYAMTDRIDDLQIGVKSTAILFGRLDTRIIALLHGLMLVMLLFLGYSLSFGVIYYAGIIAACGIMIYQQYLIHRRIPSQCFRAWVLSQWVGCVIFLSILSS